MITFVPEGRGYNWTDPSYDGFLNLFSLMLDAIVGP